MDLLQQPRPGAEDAAARLQAGPGSTHTHSLSLTRRPKKHTLFSLSAPDASHPLPTRLPTRATTHARLLACATQWRMQALVPEGGRGLARFHACVGWLTFWPGVPLHYAGDEQAFRSFGTAARSKGATLMVRHGLAAISSPDCD